MISQKKSLGVRPRDLDKMASCSADVVRCDELFVSSKLPRAEFDHVGFL
ncbi:hypothetical protein Tco_1511808, partial [Tanacetum coccineum]